MSTIILGIESSCDDTSAAVIKDGYLLSNVVASQAVHEAYGGVVPELASRAHQQNIVPVVHEALKRAEEAEKEALEAAAAEAKVSDAEERVAELEELLQKKNDEIAEAAAKADANVKATADLEAKIKELKKNPKIPKEMLDRLRSEAEAEVRKNAAAAEEKRKQEIETLKAAKAEAERKVTEARNEAEALRKKAELNDADAMRFKALFENLQETAAKIKETIGKVREKNPELAGKFSAALSAVAKQIGA